MLGVRGKLVIRYSLLQWPLPTLMLRIQRRGLTYFTAWISWLFPIPRSFTHYLDMKQVAPCPRRSDCKGLSFEVSSKVYTPRPGSFHFRQSSGTSLKRFPLYGKHFTQIPSLQSRLFLICNPICLIVKVLASFRFLFVRARGTSELSSVASDPLIRSHLLYNPRSL